ncbi:hypothetical protein BJV74DRAFT_84370 [Russula compacta]|nr:hypothetical protein BJV74DRAFT_84370 [Russula compacta]
MDAEEHRMLVSARLRCRILEVDRDVETLRAQKYQEILLELSSEDIAAPHPQAASIPPAPEGASVRPASPPPSSHLVRSIRERATARPHLAQSTGGGTNSRAGRVGVVVLTPRLSNLRKPNSASINRSAQGSRKTRPSHGVSRSSGTNDRLVQTQTTGGHMTRRRTMPTLSTFRLHSPSNSAPAMQPS